MAKSKELAPVLVEWSDIIDGGGEWHDDAHLEPVTVYTVGYLVSKGRKHIVIVRDYFDCDGRRTFGGKLAIPIGCVVKIQSLR
jgi:hypothetical protein